MPALLLLLQCAGDVKMNLGPDSTPTPTNYLRLIQWNANGISGKITELLTFIHNDNVDIATIQETKLINKTKPLRTPGWAAVRLDRHKIKGGGLLMLIKDPIPFVDNMAALPQSADPHLEQQCISIMMPYRQQLHILIYIYILPRSSCSAGHHSRWDTPFLARMKQRGYRQMAGQIRPTSVWPPIISHYYQSGQSLPHWPASICPSSTPSTQNCPRFMGLGEPTST